MIVKKKIFKLNSLHVSLSEVRYFGSLSQGLPDFYVNVTERFHLYDCFRGRVIRYVESFFLVQLPEH